MTNIAVWCKFRDCVIQIQLTKECKLNKQRLKLQHFELPKADPSQNIKFQSPSTFEVPVAWNTPAAAVGSAEIRIHATTHKTRQREEESRHSLMPHNAGGGCWRHTQENAKRLHYFRFSIAEKATGVFRSQKFACEKLQCVKTPFGFLARKTYFN